MSRVGKKAVLYIIAAICIATAIYLMAPFSVAQSTDTNLITNASISGTAGNNGWYKTTPTVSLSATDTGGPGVANTYYRLDGLSLIPYSSSFTIPEGRHTLLFYSTNTAGYNELAKIISINVDTVAPTLNITITGNQVSGVYNGAPSVNISSVDKGGVNASGNLSIEYAIDNNWLPFTANFTIPDGTHTLSYGSMDWAGNTNNSSQTVTIFNPTISFDPAPNTWYSDRNEIDIYIHQSSDVDHVDYSINTPGNWINAMTSSGNWLYFKNEGNASIYYRAVSPSGAIGPINNVWYGLDKNAPTIDVSLSGSQDKSKGWWTSKVNVQINPHDAGGIVMTQYSYDGKSWTNLSNPNGGSITVSGPTKTIYYRTEDEGGRFSPVGSTWLYFAPTTMNEGGMSNQVYINGTTSGGSTGGQTGTATASPTEGPMPTPTQQPIPTPTMVPSPLPSNTPAPATGSPLAIAVLVGVLVLLGIVAAAAYLFVFKPK